MTWLPGNSGQAAPGSLLARWLGRRERHPDAFTAGLRMDGRWHFAPSAVDPYRPDGIVSLRHGDRTLRLRLERRGGAGPRPGHLVLVASVLPTEEQIEVSVPVGYLERFGIEA